MKVCPICDKTYKDDNLNFCLDDGSTLTELNSNEPPPTVLMDSGRSTNPNYPPPVQDYQKPAFDDYDQPQFSAPNQQIYQQNSGIPQHNRSFESKDKTMPMLSLGLGIAGVCLFCCYLGFPLGIASMIIGFIGMKRVDTDPQNYDGKNLAIAGMALGGLAFFINFVFVILAIIGSF